MSMYDDQGQITVDSLSVALSLAIDNHKNPERMQISYDAEDNSYSLEYFENRHLISVGEFIALKHTADEKARESLALDVFNKINTFAQNITYQFYYSGGDDDLHVGRVMGETGWLSGFDGEQTFVKDRKLALSANEDGEDHAGTLVLYESYKPPMVVFQKRTRSSSIVRIAQDSGEVIVVPISNVVTM